MGQGNQGLYNSSPSWLRRLSQSQVNSIVFFARSLSPLEEHIELSKSQHHPDDVGEFICHIKILFQDSAKKLKTSKGRQNAWRDVRGDVAEPSVKYYQAWFH